MFVFRKTWRILFSCNTGFEIHSFPLSQANETFNPSMQNAPPHFKNLASDKIIHVCLVILGYYALKG